MLPLLDYKYLFILPMPMCSPQDKYAMLYGFSYVLTDANFNTIGNTTTICCRGYEYRLPSPSYLFMQGIDPYRIKHGLEVSSFIDELEKQLHAPNVAVFTWSVHNLKIVEKMCLRQFRECDTLDRVSILADINKVLKLHDTLNQGQSLKSDSLINCAKAKGFREPKPLSEHEAKLQALIYLVKYLHDEDPALLKYSLRNRNEKAEFINRTIANSRCMSNYNTTDRCIEILKPLSFTDNLIDALYYDGNNVVRRFYDINDFDVLSPATVLTEQRQKITGIELDRIVDALNRHGNKSYENTNSLPFRYSFFKDFSQKDMELYESIKSLKNSAAVTKAPLNTSLLLRELVFLYRGNSLAKTMMDSELGAYYKKCRELVSKQIGTYKKELDFLLNRIDENNEDQIRLLKKLQHYPYDI
ncbi:MAG: hypothetical protein ACI4UM_03300 [Succinivibrio sp.]